MLQDQIQKSPVNSSLAPLAPTKPEIEGWLREKDPERLQTLHTQADAVRKAQVGDAIHLRGLIEISSHCVRQCMYCGLRQANQTIKRYRMSPKEILACAREAASLGYGTVVLQAGEDDALTEMEISHLVQTIKSETPLAVTLSLGERKEQELRSWRSAGADRYLLRFETSDTALYSIIHPQRAPDAPKRLALLRKLKALGYEAGGGMMVGIPGQSYATLAQDILTCRALDLDMVGIGPYIAHPSTPLGNGLLQPKIDAKEQVPRNEEMVYKTIALTRLLCPTANIPSTTALATINKVDGRKRGLQVGANVVMPNLTPQKYRRLYEIYPAKACVDENPSDCNHCLHGQIQSIGRYPGRGPGGRGTVEGPLTLTSNGPSQLVQLQG